MTHPYGTWLIHVTLNIHMWKDDLLLHISHDLFKVVWDTLLFTRRIAFHTTFQRSRWRERVGEMRHDVILLDFTRWGSRGDGALRRSAHLGHDSFLCLMTHSNLCTYAGISGRGGREEQFVLPHGARAAGPATVGFYSYRLVSELCPLVTGMLVTYLIHSTHIWLSPI